MPVSRSRYELLERCLTPFTRMLQAVERQGGVPALHRARVSSRRLRELLPVLQIQGKMAADLSHRLKKITRRLGKVRDLDVLVELTQTWQVLGRYEKSSLALVASAIAKERVEARKRLDEKMPLRELRRVRSKLQKLATQLEGVDDERPGRGGEVRRGLRWAVDARIQRRGHVLKAAIEDAGAVYLPTRLHAVRIALKKYRYAVELGQEITTDERVAAALKLLNRHQELLGRWHDRQVLIDRVRQVQASLMPPDVRVWRGLDTLMMMIENDCRRLHASYVRSSGSLANVCDRLAIRLPAADRRVG
jgi:CHAD domain-containing protein